MTCPQLCTLSRVQGGAAVRTDLIRSHFDVDPKVSEGCWNRASG
jgi:hypothetical protein